MTSRLLLTLLALLTGLSVQGTPAHARVNVAQQADAGAIVSGAVARQARLAETLPVRAAWRIEVQELATLAIPAVAIAAAIPAVLTRIDRARE